MRQIEKGFQKSLYWNSLSLIFQVKLPSTSSGKLRLIIYIGENVRTGVSFHGSRLLVRKSAINFQQYSLESYFLIISLRRFIIMRLFLKIMSWSSRLQQHVKLESRNGWLAIWFDISVCGYAVANSRRIWLNLSVKCWIFRLSSAAFDGHFSD